ncbi:hypothetical protein RJT34_24401 [Clitoria ternatea]|uniref:Uncharacterized protein n=1 Tax=Clitoria ternatea TaxID=43366 RepID=A0AAN9IHG7_CLITE
MAHQEHQVSGAVPEDANDDKRLYECARKYEIIMKQFDELTGLMNNGNAVPKLQKGGKGSASGGKTATSSSQQKKNEELVQTVTKFLKELRTNTTDSESTRSKQG